MVRGEARERAIVAATLELLTEVGYERLTMHAVAARARASKATIYRRWPGKAQLVARAVRAHADAAPAPAGEPRDLLDTMRQVRDRFAGKNRGLVVGLLGAAEHDAELAGFLRAELTAQKALVGELVAGQFAASGVPADVSALVAEAATAAVAVRMLVTAEPVDDDFLRQLVEHVIQPLIGVT